ncbi:purine and uridine phosphorylase [Aspergillus unguis]
MESRVPVVTGTAATTTILATLLLIFCLITAHIGSKRKRPTRNSPKTSPFPVQDSPPPSPSPDRDPPPYAPRLSTPQSTTLPPAKDAGSYTIGWICAVSTELVAARAFLDEEHGRPEVIDAHDHNDYTLGRIGRHFVVIAGLAHGQYGLCSATSVAKSMLHSFPNIRIGLMVGIGGGAPSQKHDIRLGDIVVSAPHDGHGGVFQYDYGKAIQNQKFYATQSLNQPPEVLLTAVSGLKSQYESDGHQFDAAINSILERKPRLRKKYRRPDLESDRLYRSDIAHPIENDANCEVVCGDAKSKQIARRERTEYEDNPAIHYGLIASANLLMKDALIRDRLSAERGILCFEMEAAGLMNWFPCLVIRGICDYSDSHKNKEWQGYAAMVAAAYAKDLLHRIPPSKIEAERRIGDILADLRDISQRQLDLQENTVKQSRSDKEQECLHLFRLTSSSKDTTYEWYKDRVETRVEGTCEWFLNHDHFQHWLHQESGPLLVSADPGCGKSVLAKYLIDERLPRSATTCYFFFKSQDQNTVRLALCALLHQIFSQKPSLISYAMEGYHKNGKHLINSTASLWTIFESAVRDPQAGPLIIVLDALDECAESECEGLIQKIKSQFSSGCSSRLKYLLTSRPYEQITAKFTTLLESFPRLHIPGEDDSKTIGREVNRVIQHRVEQLAKEKKLSSKVKDHLADRLLGIPHRTYLWVYLVFDYLGKEPFKKTLKGIDQTIAAMPASIYEAYEQILTKSHQQERMVRRSLSMILAAARPLTVSEMNIALNVDKESKSIHDLDLEEDKDFSSLLRNRCGLFISIYNDRVYFLHQTAREFLLVQTPALQISPQGLYWQHSITYPDAHGVLAEACVLYLALFNHGSTPVDASQDGSEFPDRHAFLDYSAENWGSHYREASGSMCSALLSSALSICSPDSRSWSAWFELYWKTTGHGPTEGFTSLMISSYFGHEIVTRFLLESGADLEANDTRFGRTPLSWAAENGHEVVVKLLLQKGANLEASDTRFGRTPLVLAAESRHEAVINLLLQKGANLEGMTPLSWAAQYGHEAVVKLLKNSG